MPDGEKFALPIAFVGLDETRIEFANQFIVQIHEEDVILVVGQLAPPMLMGTDDEKRAQAKSLPFVPLRVSARYGMPIARARQLHELLGKQLAVADSRSSKAKR